MKTNRPLSTPDDGKTIVKKILLFSSAGTLAFCAISSSPHWMLRLAISAAALLAMVYELSRSAPVGYEDQAGFHYCSAPGRRRRVRKHALPDSVFAPTRSPLKA
jgi:hypothetical protein